LRAGYCAEAQAFFTRLATPPAAGRAARYDALIRTVIAAGVWARLDALYLLAAADAATALTNLVSSDYAATAVNSPTFTADHGYTGGSTKYIDSHFNPSTALSPRFIQDSATLAHWTISSADDGEAIGYYDGALNVAALFRAFNDGADKMFVRLNRINAADLNLPVGAMTGLLACSRTSSSTVKAYSNGVETGSGAQSSTGIPAGTIKLLGRDATTGSADLIGAAAIGGLLTAEEHLALYNALYPYLQAVAGVP
jgi:hypothetical protein